MSTPRRRSARLRSSATPEARKITPLTALKLGSLMERDETPDTGPQSNLDTILSTPGQPTNAASTEPTSQFTFTVKTPSTAGQAKPEHYEMHPSKAQQSTAKKPDSGLRFGFTDVNNMARANSVTNTPSKQNNPFPNNMPSPQFKFTRTDSKLSQEAQKLMDGLREEAARIKEQIALERAEQARKDGEAEELYSAVGRKIAKPRGKAGRFSDVHMNEFKKMDSIAGHASAYRARPVPVQSSSTSLKRSPSKAELDQIEKQATTSKKPHASNPVSSTMQITSPTKRFRQLQSDDASSSRPTSSDGDSPNQQFKSNLPRSQPGLPTAITTPTKASLARSASVKTLKTTNIPTLARSPSTLSLTAPNTVGAVGVSPSKTKSFLPTATTLKSILRRHQPLVSNDPVKIAAGTHVAPSPNLNKDLPDTPQNELDPPSSSTKRVGWTSSTKNRHSIMPGAFMSPSKVFDFEAPSPTKRVSTPQAPKFPIIAYPNLSNAASPVPSKSPGGNHIFAKFTSPTIRRVRPSDVTSDTVNQLTSFSPAHSGFPNAHLPSVPHGMPNKKRRRESDDNEEENRRGPEQLEESSAKRVKRALTADPLPLPQKSPSKSRIPRSGAAGARAKGKGILSLSRLNMLARPKERK